MTKYGGQFALASPAPNSGGTCPLCPPVIYAHASDRQNKYKHDQTYTTPLHGWSIRTFAVAENRLYF